MEVQTLGNEDQAEVVRYLSRRPIHTVCMVGYILDHGIVSPLNRGTFFGCRDSDGLLRGVALIGHATLLEADNDEAIKAFAAVKHHYGTSHLIRGEHSLIRRFWQDYAEIGKKPRLACRELLFELEKPPEIPGPKPELLPATAADLETVMQINAELLQAECGINPIQRDSEGFRQRVLARIEHQRVWKLSRNNRLVFKADVFSETPEMTYLEGVYVNPLERGRGQGWRCLSELSRLLLGRSKSLCLLFNENRVQLQNFYRKAGYGMRGWYDTIYLHPEAS